jgi:hypothetical protein
MLVATSYLVGVFLVSQPNPRYFGPAWPMLLPLFALPADALLAFARSYFVRYETDPGKKEATEATGGVLAPEG